MRRHGIAMLGLVATLAPAAFAQQWTALNHQPGVPMGGYFLLMDGRVLANEMEVSGLATVRWWTLSPDAQGSYRNGTWSQVGSSVYTHLYFASSITPAGKVLVAGGEYSTGGSETNKCELFNPLTNTWSPVTPPSGWSNIGDAPAATLPDGRMIVGDIFGPRTAIYDPNTNSFSAGPNKLNTRTTEETWVTLPDGSITTWDCFGHPGAERYLPSTNQWVTAGNTSVDLVLPSSYETGAGIVMPSGKMFAIGGTPRTAFYQFPAVFNQPGTWTTGPVPPLVNGNTVGAEDAPATLTPNGRVLMPLGRVSAGGGQFYAPTYFFEYDGTNIVRVPDAPNSAGPPYVGRLLLLPTGEILWTAGTTAGYLYTNGGAPNPAWKPAISNAPGVIERGQSYVLQGTQLTGVSNGCSYGDEYDPATNYPLARLRDPGNGNTYYLRTYSPSTRQIQTGNTVLSVNFEVGNNVPDGSYELRVVANGIPSDPVNVQVGTAGCNVDQNQPNAPTYMAGFSQGDLAQSFQHQRANSICGAGIYLQPNIGSSDNVSISLWNGLPNQGGSMLATGSTQGTQGTWCDVSWNPVAISGNSTYYLVFGGNTTLGIAGDTNNPYPHGQVYANAGFQSFPAFDYTFRTFSGAASGIDLAVAGACPGSVTVRWSNAQPNATVALIFAKNTGSFVIPFGPCQGTVLGLGNQGIRLVNTFPSGANGSGSRTGNTGAGSCRAYLQMHDIPNCTTSNVARLP